MASSPAEIVSALDNALLDLLPTQRAAAIDLVERLVLPYLEGGDLDARSAFAGALAGLSAGRMDDSISNALVSGLRLLWIDQENR